MDRCYPFEMPVRKIPKSYRNVTGIKAETKAVGQARFESPLERDFIALLEFSPDVRAYEVQPVTIKWRDAIGRPRSYTPDVWVEFRDDLKLKPWLCEVKLRSQIKKDWGELHPKFRRGIRYAKSRGARFRLMTEQEIRTPFLSNVRFLLPYRRREVAQSSIGVVLEVLQRLGRSSVSELLGALSVDPWEQAEWLPTIWHLVASMRIGADLESDLNMSSPLWSL